ncbi:hypothetical protein B2G71_12995 [Novosphingobium sp. PC22D]|uniref:hypothetical protein n=1 Tax=Novosphingobium sp. PC22D TaxID=1962403 RepID=UPI000BF1CEC1|nr:hypothetical protein [Novosphingobium sp. PC22D]PEQ12060.1 hypothetical protein B2G71_12995 [Novosphingobium sp. PC22D]
MPLRNMMLIELRNSYELLSTARADVARAGGDDTTDRLRQAESNFNMIAEGLARIVPRLVDDTRFEDHRKRA